MNDSAALAILDQYADILWERRPGDGIAIRVLLIAYREWADGASPDGLETRLSRVIEALVPAE